MAKSRISYGFVNVVDFRVFLSKNTHHFKKLKYFGYQVLKTNILLKFKKQYARDFTPKTEN